MVLIKQKPIQWLMLAVCVSRMAYASVLVVLVISYGATVHLLEFETPSGYICIMRDQAAIDPSVVITEAASGGHCIKKWGMLIGVLSKLTKFYQEINIASPLWSYSTGDGVVHGTQRIGSGR